MAPVSAFAQTSQAAASPTTGGAKTKLGTWGIDLTARDVPELVTKLNGRKLVTAAGERVLATSGAATTTMAPDWRTRFLAIITDPSVALLLLVGTIALTVIWLARQIQRAVVGEPLNVPKYLLLAAAIPMHWIVLLTPMPHKPIAIVAILTIYHNFQYHRLIWFHNKKYKSAGDVETSRSKYGAAELISRRLFFYIGFGILFGLIYQGPRQFLGYLSYKNGAASLTDISFATQLAISFLWGYAFIHYYLDSKIWRVRRDPSVGKALNMA